MGAIDVRWLTAFIDRPAATFDAAVEFWREVTGTSLSTWRGEHGEFATLLPPGADAHLRVQRVASGPGGTHLDVHVADGVIAAADGAEALGARVVGRLDDVVVMASPAGLPWCLVEHRGESILAAPHGIADGPPAGVEQVCVDVAPDRFDAECHFWAALTGWDVCPTGRPEFLFLERPTGMPMRILLQRLDERHADRDVEAHLDLYSADADEAAQQHASLGAVVVDEFPWWVVMADPAGVRYCLIRREPTPTPSGGG